MHPVQRCLIRSPWFPVAAVLMALSPDRPAAAQLTELGAKILEQCSAADACETADHFGLGLAVGDFDDDGFDDLAVGVPGQTDAGQQAAGAVHVFYGSPGGLLVGAEALFNQSTAGIAGVSEAGDQFGRVLLAADLDVDGFDDLAIGGPFEDVGNVPNAGTVWVLFGSSSGLTATGSLIINQNSLHALGGDETAEIDDHFGSALAAGDVHFPGVPWLAIGTPGEDFGLLNTNEGKVEMVEVDCFSGPLCYSGDIHQEIFTGPGRNSRCNGVEEADEPGDAFGSAIAFLNGNPNFVVGVRGEDLGGQVDAGRIVNPFCWSQDTPSVAGSAEGGDLFGAALAAGDFDGDGDDDLAIGVPGEGIEALGHAEAGAVNMLLYSESDRDLTVVGNGLFTQADFAPQSAAGAFDHFGQSLAAGDFDADGADDLAIGAPDDNVNGVVDAGEVNVLYGVAGAGLALPGRQTFNQDFPPGMPDSANTSDRFGFALAAGDFDGNGADDLAIGVPGEDLGKVDRAGEVTVLYGFNQAFGGFGQAAFAAGSALTFSESSAGTKLVFVVRTGGAVIPASISHVYFGGTATPGSDFGYTPGTISWPAGDLGVRIFTFQLIDDDLDEPDETLSFDLRFPSSGLSDQGGTLTITILDDDLPPPPPEIFADGFESGDTSAWSATEP